MLNLFSDQLSKVILDFNPNTINASLLSGKGSITNLRLNVDVINEFLNKPPHGTVPFVKFTEIRLSELRVEVTSYTNLKKAPIVLVIEEIHASAVEPMEYFLDPANAQNKNSPSKPQQASQQQQQSTQARQAYGLLHRILDNLSIKINRIHLTFQTLGKFKTLRRGRWTPPPVSVTLENIEWISMTEAGNPGTPEAVWAHNELFAQQNRFRREGNMTLHRSYIIYKRLSMICHVRLSSEAHYEQSISGKDVKSAALISNTQIDVHVAYSRRLRDAGVTGIDVDVLCHDMDINLDIASLSKTSNGGSHSNSSGCDVGSFVHMMIGLLHCYYKDRTFVDPLLPDGVRNEATEQKSIKDVQSVLVDSTENVEMEEEEIGPDDFMPEISLVDDEDSDSDYEDEPDEEHDEAFLEWKRRHDMQKDTDINEDSAVDDDKAVSEGAATAIEEGVDEESDKNEAEKKAYKRKRKAVIVVASGAQKFEKLSFSFSVSRINMKLFLPSHSSLKRGGLDTADRHCLELLLEGLVAECIWPKVDGEIGGHVQCSFAYVHILDLLQRLCVSSDNGVSSWTSVKLFPLLKIGTRLFQGHDIFALPQYLKNGWGEKLSTFCGVDKCEEFPSMEPRQTTWTWDRPRRGKRAFGLKSTVSFVDDKLTKWSKTNVNHEACLGVVDVVLDSVPIDNMMKVFSDYNYIFDARWMSGDWTAEICSDMLATSDFHIKDYIQPLPTLYHSRGISSPSTFPSTELRSITAHLGTITIRLPNPGDGISSFGMSDVICGFTEATIIVSSNLPKSFLSGKIMASENNNPGFPNDPTDMSCSLGAHQASSSDVSTQFRMQLSVQNFSVDIVPMHRHESNGISVVAPTNVTLMTCLEQNGINQNIIVSILLQELESNINLRQLCGALQTLNYHASNIISKHIHSVSSHDDGNIADNNDGENGNATVSLTLCFHMPSFNLKCWGEDSDNNDQLLLHAQANQIELGSESVRDNFAHRNVMKVVLETFSVKICSESDIVELISVGSNTSEVLALGKIASGSSSSSPNEMKKKFDNSGLSLRVEHQCDGKDSDTMSSLSCAMDCTSSLALSLSLTGIEVFLKKVVDALSLPVLEQSKNISIGNSTCSSIHQLCSIFESGRDGSDAASDNDELTRNTMMRLFLSDAVIVVEISDEKSFLLLMNDSEIASGQYDKIAALDNGASDENLLVCKHCGGSNQSWIDAYHMIDNDKNEASDIFYALGSKFTVMSILTRNNFDTVVPTNAVDYRFPIPKGGVSTASSVDVSSMKKMMGRFIKIGSSFSSSYFSLYSMMDREDLSTTATRFHSMISIYHKTMQDVISGMNAEVQSLRRGVFFKERERFGALALASSTACGWVRVGEDSSFSTARLFTSATFWRYWMVLDKSVILLYKAPGCTSPSFIIPLHERTKLRTISLSSSSNKNNTVVGNHLRQRGFSLFDELEGMELYFVTSSQAEYDSFVSAISRHLKLFQTDTDYIRSSDVFADTNDSTSDAGSSSQTNRIAQVESNMSEAVSQSDLNELQTVLEAAGAGDDFKYQNAEESEEMVEVQLNEDGAGEVVYNSQLHNVQSEEKQLFQHEDISSSHKATTNVSLSMRERLAMAKGISKLSTSKFGSTLKSAKLAASEISREDIKLKGSQKMTVLKKTANTKLSSAANLGASLMQATTAVRSSIQDQSIRTTSSDSMDKNNLSKLDKMNKSMSGAMQRLHIDDKVSRISTAVKSVRSENHVIRQLSNELGPRRRIGIADENSDKPVKFDARDTFTAVSGHPTKVKSIAASGEILATSRGNSLAPADLHKFETRWRVEVSVSRLSIPGEKLGEENDETKDSSVNQNHQDTKYEITLTDICNELDKHSVERSIGDLLIFHVSISELLTKTAATRDFHQTSSFEQLHVAGSVLERLIDGKDVYPQSVSSLESIYCERVKMFVSTLLETSLPRQAIEATTDFLGIRGEGGLVTRKLSDYNRPNSSGKSCAATAQTDVAFDTFSNALLEQRQAVTSTNLLDLTNDCAGSNIFETIMTAYNKVTIERDTALATLAVTSVLNDHQIMQKQLARNKPNQQEQGRMQRQGSVHQSSDDEMLALCKQLGSEIAAKASAELEINRLKEQLELERRIAREKEAGLLEQLSKKE